VSETNPAPPLDAAILEWLQTLAAQGVMITDADLVIRAWNGWLETHSGRPAAQVVGRPLLEVWPDLVARGLDHHYRDALGGQVRVVAQALHGYLFAMPRRAADDTPMPQSARIAPLTVDGRVVGTITTVDDVSDRTLREAELREQIEALKLAREAAEDALRIKDEFLATLSHELRTPLNSVLGWTRILRYRYDDAASLRRGLEVIERNGAAQLRLIEDMLDMSRMMSGKLRVEMRETDVVAAALTAVDALTPTAVAKGVTIRTHITPGLPAVMGDPDRLSQVAWNLLANAVKFTPAGGTVDVAVQAAPGAILLRVTDTGQGITADFLPHIFEPFRQGDASTTRRHGGLGLGLALVRRIVDLHGGRVTAHSTGSGRGATFTVYLPAAAPLAPRGRAYADGADPDATALKGLRLLVVDDEPEARELLAMQLEAAGASVTVAASSADALAVVKAAAPLRGLDALVADIGMPEQDGYALMRAIRALPPRLGGATPAVAVTAYARPEERARALAIGYQRHFVKPVDIGLLAMALSEVIAESRGSTAV
jgi:signal transduction histidine kinase/ActR/RegA family two-component response regulator